MFAAVKPQLLPLDLPTLAFVAVCLAAMLGLLLLSPGCSNATCARWPGGASAYLIGASSIALWGTPAPMIDFPQEFAQALTFVACGMIWNGVRLFHGRPLLPTAAFIGAFVWIVLCQLPAFAEGSNDAHRARRLHRRDLHLLHRPRITARTAQIALFAHRRRSGALRACGDLPDAARHAGILAARPML